MFRPLKRVFVSLIVAIIAFYPLFTPVAFAVDSWSGNPWTGDTWEGDPWEGKTWDGSNLQWEGDPWEGNGTEGETWNGEGTQGEGWNSNPMQSFNPGNQWQTLPWHLQGWTANGYLANPWSQNGFNGSGTTGSPWLQNGFNGSPWLQYGFNGNGTAGSPWGLTGFSGNGTIGLPFTQIGFSYNPDSITGGIDVLKSWHDQFINTINSDGYKTADYLVKGVVQGKANLIGNFLSHENMKDMGYDSKFGYASVGEFRRNILMNGLKLGLGNNILFDAYDTASNSKKLVKGTIDTVKTRQFINATKNAKDITSGVDNVHDLANSSKVLSKAPPHPAAVGALSKFNIAASAVGTVMAGIDTYNKVDTFTDVLGSNASTSEKVAAGAGVGEGVGNMMMNASVAIAAVNPVVGLGVGAAGAGVWLASRATRFVSNNWKGFNMDTVKSMGDSIVESGKKTFKKIKGWFS